MTKLVKLDVHYWPLGGYGHWCPGCDSGHEINVDTLNYSGAKWSFDGDVQCPTFTPSVNIRWGRFADPNYKPEEGHDHSGICHYNITAGKIVFHADSTHKLAGQTVELPDIPDGVYLTSQRLL